MKCKVADSAYKVDRNHSNKGAEGTVYPLTGDQVVKWFFSDTILGQPDKWERIDVLRSLLEKAALGSAESFVAVPLDNAYGDLDLHQEELIGYTMKRVQDAQKIFEVQYDWEQARWKHSQMTDRRGVGLCAQLFDTLRVLHQRKVVVGDLNEDNILIDGNVLLPCFIDVDSFQCPGHNLQVAMAGTLADSSLFQTKGADGSIQFIATRDTDIFALTVACVLLMLGDSPFNFGHFDVVTGRPVEQLELKRKGVSIFSYHSTGAETVKGYTIEDPSKDLLFRRLDVIKRDFRSLYDFFLKVFEKNERGYFSLSEHRDRSTPKSPVTPQKTHSIRNHNKIKVKDDRSDPLGLKLFMDLYGITVY